MSTWVNNDGLEVRFGNSQAALEENGKYSVHGEEDELVFVINGTDVPSADAPITKRVTIPSGSYITSATLVVGTAFTSGGAATLDIGTFVDDNDGTYSVLDADGIDAAIAVASLTADASIACNGAQINTTVTDATNGLPIVVSYGYNTAAFTAGKAELIVKYRQLA